MDEFEYRIAYIGAKDVSLINDADNLEKLYRDFRGHERTPMSSCYERKLFSAIFHTRGKIRKVLEEC